MIFVTVGSVFPFDRLIETMDHWAREAGRGEECLAQIGKGAYKPQHMNWQETLDHAEFGAAIEASTVIVAHAGMGSVITAMQHGKPIVMLPRRFEAGEHTTDHQMATARWLEPKPGVYIAWDETELPAKIAEAANSTRLSQDFSPYAPSDFTDRLSDQLSRWTDKS